MNAEQLRLYLIRPTLEYLGMGGLNAENLLLGTAAQESALGQYIKQVGGGPAEGIFQMEPMTESDIWENFIVYNNALEAKMRMLLIPNSTGMPQLIINLAYSVAMARLQYRRFPEPLPADVEGMAALWKKRYNTFSGKGTALEFIENYRHYVEPH